jgi:ABC-type glycerol-3-phosphate transport system permease component
VPLILIVYANVAAVCFLVTVIRLFVDIASLGDPSNKAMVLARGISAMMNAAAFGFIMHIPVLVGVYFVDRWLVRRTTTS